jgi:hypothetical protein
MGFGWGGGRWAPPSTAVTGTSPDEGVGEGRGGTHPFLGYPVCSTPTPPHSQHVNTRPQMCWGPPTSHLPLHTHILPTCRCIHTHTHTHTHAPTHQRGRLLLQELHCHYVTGPRGHADDVSVQALAPELGGNAAGVGWGWGWGGLWAGRQAGGRAGGRAGGQTGGYKIM